MIKVDNLILMTFFHSFLALFYSFVGNRFIKVNFVLAVLLNIVCWVMIWWFAKALADQIPLHYNIYFGIDLFGSRYRLYEMPALGLVGLVINYFLGSFAFDKEKLLGYFLAIGSVAIQIVILVSSALIIYINT